MFILQGDIESISDYVIIQMRRRKLDLVESARKVMIARAFKAWREQGLRVMRETVEWEFTLLPEFKRYTDKVVDVCDRSKLRNGKALTEFLAGINLTLQSDELGYWVVAPKTYDVTLLRKRINAILRGN